MKSPQGLRARTSVSSSDGSDTDTVCDKRLPYVLPSSWSLVRLARNILNPRSRSYSLLLLTLGTTTTLTLIYLSRHWGTTGTVGIWEEDEEWHRLMGERIREKLARAREGEIHHRLDHEEEHWISKTGLELHHDPDIVAHLPQGEQLNVAVSLPFIDRQPLAAEAYIKMLEWITIYSTVRIHFHVITNTESAPFIDQIMSKVNLTSNCNFHYSLVSFDDIIDFSQAELCPDLAVSTEYCNLLMGQLTPLIFPFLLPSLPYVIYVDKNIIFHDDVGKLYNSLLKLEGEEAIAMVQEQSLRYMRAFGTHHLKQPGTKLGKPPSKGSPGYNTDLMLLDLNKLREDSEYRAALGELKLSLTMRKYSYHPESQILNLGDVLNLMAAERPRLFHQLPCEWNKSSQQGTDPLLSDFLACLQPTTRAVRATNRNPSTNAVK